MAFEILRRQPPTGTLADWIKFFAPPQASPSTPDQISTPDVFVQRTLLNRIKLTMFDGKEVVFFTFNDPADPIFASGTYPAKVVRMRQGVKFIGSVSAKTGSHTIHWHGIEPTPMNDGVGHTSFELGQYNYQWQPNFPGTYFYHCHKNTVLHMEMGLAGLLLFDPELSANSSLSQPPLTGYPNGGPGRAAANLEVVPDSEKVLLPSGFVEGFDFDPLTKTVAYDVEAWWLGDEIDSRWHTLGHNAFVAKAAVNGPFTTNGIFHDFNPDYFFVTGVNVAPDSGKPSVGPDAEGTVTAPSDPFTPPNVAQVVINANAGDTILIRTLDIAYVKLEFSVDLPALIIAQDGRALGRGPYGQYNFPLALPANTPFQLGTAMRRDLLLRPETPGNFTGRIKFIHYTDGRLLFTAKIPIVIS